MKLQPLEKIVNSYPRILKNGNVGPYVCSFILMADDKPLRQMLSAVCHADLYYNGLKSKIATHLYTSFPISNEMSIKFFNMMKTRLFKNWSDFMHLEEFEGEKYIKIDNLDKIPAPVFYNMCIMSRFPSEFPKQFLAWTKFLDIGVDEAFAYILSSVVFKDHYNLTYPKKPLDTEVNSVYTQDHWPFYNTLSINKFVAGNPDFDPKLVYTDHPTKCKPTNIIWGSTQDLRYLPGKTIRQFAEKNNYAHLLQHSG